jgi:hypothetical protein
MKKVLDLHGVKHEDVSRYVTYFIEDHWDCDDVVDIITGHSSIMRDIVIEVLEDYKLSFWVDIFGSRISIKM